MAKRKKAKGLSKTLFMAGLQCHKRLWMQVYQPEEAGETDAATQGRFDQGNAVGELARGYIPGGVLVEETREKLAEALQRTRELLADGSVPAICEATIGFENILARVDILARNADGTFDLLEVKSSTRVKPEHLWDVAIQAYVLRAAGLKIQRAGLLHIDTSYVYPGGEYDLQRLFALSDLTFDVEAVIHRMPVLLKEMGAMLGNDTPPAVEPGEQCHSPYPCPFTAECIPPPPEHGVGELYRIGDALFQRFSQDGIERISDIPGNYGLSPLQQRQRDAVTSGLPFLDGEIARVLAGLEHPLYFLDFETFNPAIPLYPGTRPYQQVPFQWSVHRQDVDGTTPHLEFLYEHQDDPRPALVDGLIAALGEKGPICVYSPFENTQLRNLAEALPHHAAALEAIQGRLVDLLALVRANVYHPEFHGSFSIKSVLPALVPDSDYSDLAITDGSSASTAYWNLVQGAVEPSREAQIRQELLDYCGRDTEALLRLYEKLRKKE